MKARVVNEGECADAGAEALAKATAQLADATQNVQDIRQILCRLREESDRQKSHDGDGLCAELEVWKWIDWMDNLLGGVHVTLENVDEHIVTARREYKGTKWQCTQVQEQAIDVEQTQLTGLNTRTYSKPTTAGRTEWVSFRKRREW